VIGAWAGQRALLREAGLLAGLAALFGCHFARTRPTNFGGWDEWLVIDLTSRGIVALPFEGRPFSLAFNLAGSLLTPQGLSGYYAMHVVYLLGAAAFLMYVLRATGVVSVRLAWCAAAIACVWAPLDDLRLDAVLLTNYSGAAFASMGALLLLVESRRRQSLLLLVTAALIAAFVIRVLEATAALLCLAPVCLLPLRGDRRSFVRWTAVWLVITGAALTFAAWPVLMPPAGGSYQTQGLGFDPHPVRVATRLLRLLGFELVPLLTPSSGEVFGWPAGLAALTFGAVWWGAAPARGDAFPAAGRHAPAALAGLLAAVLALLIFALSPAIRIPARTQILTAPGMGLFLASAIFGLSALFRRRAYLAAGILGAWIAAVGTGRAAAMQREWDGRSFWPAQRASLASHLREAPDLVPGTFVVLLDGVTSWPATFTYHHAVSYLYERRATGMAWGAEPFLYPAAFGPYGLVLAPLESIRSPWNEPVRLYPYDHLVVLRQRPDGAVSLEETWPAEVLGPLPAGARYTPRARLAAGPPGPRARILAEPPLWGSIPR
jgi:hypothetical protein